MAVRPPSGLENLLKEYAEHPMMVAIKRWIEQDLKLSIADVTSITLNQDITSWADEHGWRHPEKLDTGLAIVVTGVEAYTTPINWKKGTIGE